MAEIIFKSLTVVSTLGFALAIFGNPDLITIDFFNVYPELFGRWFDFLNLPPRSMFVITLIVFIIIMVNFGKLWFNMIYSILMSFLLWDFHQKCEAYRYVRFDGLYKTSFFNINKLEDKANWIYYKIKEYVPFDEFYPTREYILANKHKICYDTKLELDQNFDLYVQGAANFKRNLAQNPIIESLQQQIEELKQQAQNFKELSTTPMQKQPIIIQTQSLVEKESIGSFILAHPFISVGIALGVVAIGYNMFYLYKVTKGLTEATEKLKTMQVQINNEVSKGFSNIAETTNKTAESLTLAANASVKISGSSTETSQIVLEQAHQNLSGVITAGKLIAVTRGIMNHCFSLGKRVDAVEAKVISYDIEKQPDLSNMLIDFKKQGYITYAQSQNQIIYYYMRAQLKMSQFFEAFRIYLKENANIDLPEASLKELMSDSQLIDLINKRAKKIDSDNKDSFNQKHAKETVKLDKNGNFITKENLPVVPTQVHNITDQRLQLITNSSETQQTQLISNETKKLTTEELRAIWIRNFDNSNLSAIDANCVTDTITEIVTNN